MPVVGIGGIFFRAQDTTELAAWYKQHFGIGMPWQQEAGPTVLAPFGANTDYFPAEKTWMLNLRVTDLDSLIGTLRAAGLAVVTNPEWDTPETGRFARVHDPEGNPVELWEPPAD